MAVTFIGGGNQSAWRAPPTCQVTDKLYHIMLYSEYTSPERDLNSSCVFESTSNTKLLATARNSFNIGLNEKKE